METLRPVRWFEGLFLRPHHLQQQQLYYESRDHGLLAGLVPCGWGLIGFEADPDQLNNFFLAVRRLRALLPDGTLIDVPGNAHLPTQNFERSMAETGRPLLVQVGVRRRDERQPQTAQAGAPGTGARFRVSCDEVPNLETGREPQRLEFLEYDLKLFFGDDPTDGFETLPVCQLVGTGDRARPVTAEPRYAPPSMTLAAAPSLLETTRAVVERLSRVIPALAEARGSQDPGTLILFQALGGALPVLRDMVQDGQIHPRQAYLELARLAGTLLYRDDEGRPPEVIPAYDHRAPFPAFDRLRVLIHQLSEPIFERRFLRLAMERQGDLYRVGLPADAKQPGARLLLEVSALESEPRIGTILKIAKISSPARIDHLAKFALPGIPTDMLTSPPPELPPGQTAAYFRLRLEDSQEWRSHTVAGSDLAVFVLGCPADLRLNLIVLFAGA